MTTLYGIKNCDTVKKARRWLENHGHEYRFHDFRGDGFDTELASTWAQKLDPKLLVNRRSTTWKKLNDTEKTRV